MRFTINFSSIIECITTFTDTIVKEYIRSTYDTGYPTGHGGCKNDYNALRGYVLNEEDIEMVKNIPQDQRQCE